MANIEGSKRIGAGLAILPFGVSTLVSEVSPSLSAQTHPAMAPQDYAVAGMDPYLFDNNGVFARGVISNAATSWTGD